MSRYTLHVGDALAVLRGMPSASVDACVTDPPYGIAFMCNRWDYDVPTVELWREVLRVLQPGGHLLAFSGTRTQHRMAVRIEDAGFEIRDVVAWVYGEGFPKSLDVSKAIDKAGGDPAAAKQWSGWGTALKPALEPITVARKRLVGTVAENVLRHGTGAINVDACRVGDEVLPEARSGKRNVFSFSAGATTPERVGRWPANLIHDGSDEVVGLFPAQESVSRAAGVRSGMGFGGAGGDGGPAVRGSSGSAGRFFYCAKSSASERGNGNSHPTVKPIALMRWLIRLVTPPGGIVLDPFAGSGTTGVACLYESVRPVLIEREERYAQIARERLDSVDPLLARGAL